MTTFKVKDLMIQLPDAGEKRDPALCAISDCRFDTGFTPCPPRSIFCDWRTCYRLTCPALSEFCFANTCRPLTDMCWRGTVVDCGYTRPDCGATEYWTIKDPTIVETIVGTIGQTVTIKNYVEQGGDLAALQAQMRQALASVDEAVRARDEALAPKTVEEIDKVEQQLKAALNELKERKAKLQK